MKKIVFLTLILIAATYISCERDDICAESTATTPNLLIEFYDVSNQENLKSVTNLVVIGVNNDEALSDNATTNNISLPLNTKVNMTQYVLWSDYEIDDNDTPDDVSDDEYDFATGNRDTITINYNRENVYVSRACGFKTIFTNVTITLEEDIDDRWITSEESVNNNQSIEDETETHFHIFH